MFDVQVDVIDTIKKGFDLIFKVTDEKMVRLCRNGELKRIKQALQNGGNVNAWEERGRTLIIEASAKGNLELVQLLIRFQADVNAKDDKGITALMEASRRGYLFTVEALIRAGADVNATTHSGWTALMQAVKFSHPQTTQVLLENGAKPSIKTKHGKRAIDFLPKNKNVFEGTKALKLLEYASNPKKQNIPQKSERNREKPSLASKLFEIFKR